MEILQFKEIKCGMSVLYKKDKEIYATKVVSTSYGHPSIEMVTLEGGFIIYYGNKDQIFTIDPKSIQPDPRAKAQNQTIYADSALNRTELLLESETILTDLRTE